MAGTRRINLIVETNGGVLDLGTLQAFAYSKPAIAEFYRRWKEYHEECDTCIHGEIFPAGCGNRCSDLADATDCWHFEHNAGEGDVYLINVDVA